MKKLIILNTLLLSLSAFSNKLEFGFISSQQSSGYVFKINNISVNVREGLSTVEENFNTMFHTKQINDIIIKYEPEYDVLSCNKVSLSVSPTLGIKHSTVYNSRDFYNLDSVGNRVFSHYSYRNDSKITGVVGISSGISYNDSGLSVKYSMGLLSNSLSNKTDITGALTIGIEF